MSGTAAMADIETTLGNTGIAGVFVFSVRGGQVVDNNDRIIGGAGADTLAGGIGYDTFVYKFASEGGDTIKDFTSRVDKIEISALGFGGGLVAGTTPTLVTVSNLNNAPGNQPSGYFIFVTGTPAGGGTLYWDPTGGPRTDAVVIATLEGVTSLAASDIVIVAGTAADPLVLDLDGNGYAFNTSVSFDINGDGHVDRVAWNSAGDGMLAMDSNGDGVVNDGTELFSQYFNGDSFISGAAALASLDTNGDGIIDMNDAAFANLVIWRDVNADGITDAGELSGLAAHGIASIGLATTASSLEVSGQELIGMGNFTRADGSSGSFAEVALNTDLGHAPAATQVAGTDGDDMLVAVGGTTQTVFTGGEGADTFVLDPAALQGLHAVDIIADYSGAEGDRIDLSALLDQALGAPATDLSAVSIAQNGASTDVMVQVGNDAPVVVASVAGVHQTLNILYNEDHHGTASA